MPKNFEFYTIWQIYQSLNVVYLFTFQLNQFLLDVYL